MAKDITKIWASQGITVPLTDAKYKLGWEVEIPTFENFNYVLQGLDDLMLQTASKGHALWNTRVDYEQNAAVSLNNQVYYARRAINGSPTNTTPDVDTYNWSRAQYIGGDSAGYPYNDPLSWNTPDQSYHSTSLGVMVDSLVGDQSTPINTWTQQGFTVKGQTAAIAWRLNNAQNTKLVVRLNNDLYISEQNSVAPNGSTYDIGVNTHLIMHSGNIGAALGGEVQPLADTVSKRDTTGRLHSTGLVSNTPAQATSPLIVTKNGSDQVIRETTIQDLADQINILNGGITGVPTGTIVAWPSDNIISGWIACRGASLSQTAYANLFAVIGSSYGGSASTFKVPDLRGRFVRGWDAGIGRDSGRSLHSYQGDGIKNHTHNYRINNQTVTYRQTGSGATRTLLSTYNYPTSYNNSGGTNDTRPMNLAMNYIIKL